jgi:hypothetical protein
MSDQEVIQVAHEFIPKLLRRKVNEAIINREAFVLEIKKQMVPLILANRNAYAAERKIPWYKKISSILFDTNTWEGEILSIEEAARVPFEDYDGLVRVTSSLWRSFGQTHRYDPLMVGPHWDAVNELITEIRKGSKWVEHIYALQSNLKNSTTRRVSISENVLSSINYWQQQNKP